MSKEQSSPRDQEVKIDIKFGLWRYKVDIWSRDRDGIQMPPTEEEMQKRWEDIAGQIVAAGGKIIQVLETEVKVPETRHPRGYQKDYRLEKRWLIWVEKVSQ